MATTIVHAITKDIGHAISYAMGNKIESHPKNEASEGFLYELDEKTMEATYYTLTAFQNCGNVYNPVEDFKYLMNRYGRDEIQNGNPRTKDGKPILGWHLIQSFDGIVETELANEIGKKLAKEIFPDNPTIISTHTNTDNTHNHIIVCAWKRNGGKWHLNHESYRKIRACSDRLCDEHGLPVLEHTRNQRLVSWKDKNGKTHYYEPTARKNELIEKRNSGVAYPDDVNSYRNTMSYELSDAKKRTNIAFVKQAIDEALPYAVSYEHLLMLLKTIGVENKSKRKNGKYLEHTIFIHPLATKGVRDSSLDKKTGFYEKEGLTKFIEEQNKDPNRKQPCLTEYRYGDFNLQCLDENSRMEYSIKNYYEPIPRSEIEHMIICDVKDKDRLLHSFFSGLDKTAVIHQIQESLDSLKYIEDNHFSNYQQITEKAENLQKNASDSDADVAKELARCKLCLTVLDRLNREYIEREKRQKETQKRHKKHKEWER